MRQSRSSRIPTWRDILAALATTAFIAPATAWAQPCYHLGGQVQCPTNPATGMPLPGGSESLSFVPGGTDWQVYGDGIAFIPQTTFLPYMAPSPTPYSPAPPVSGSSPGGSANVGAPTTAAGQLALTAAPSPDSTAERTYGVDWDMAEMLAIPDPDEQADLVSFGDVGIAAQFLFPFSGPGGATGVDLPTHPDRAETAAAASPAAPPSPRAVGSVPQALHDPAVAVFADPGFTSFLEEMAADDDSDARDEDRFGDAMHKRAQEWRKLADDARHRAEVNRERAKRWRAQGHEDYARESERDAQSDDQDARNYDQHAHDLDGQADDAHDRAQQARQQAQDRRDAVRRAREQAKKAARERAERARERAAKAAHDREAAREARRAKQAAQQRAKQAARERARDAARRAYERQLRGGGGGGGGSSGGHTTSAHDVMAAVGAARASGKPNEKKGVLATVFGWLKDKLIGTAEDKAKEKVLERTGVKAAIENSGLEKSVGAVSEGLGQLHAVKKLADSMNAELRRMPRERRTIEDRIDFYSDPHSRPSALRHVGSHTLYGREYFGTVARMVKANQ